MFTVSWPECSANAAAVSFIVRKSDPFCEAEISRMQKLPIENGVGTPIGATGRNPAVLITGACCLRRYRRSFQ